MQNHTININGGSDKIHYYISGNYMNNPGIMENSGYERYSARVNLDAEVKDWFTIGVNAYGTRGKEELGLLKTESNANFYTYMQATTKKSKPDRCRCKLYEMASSIQGA